MNQASLFFFFKIIFSLGVIYFLGTHLDFHQVKNDLSHLSYASFFFCLLWLWSSYFTGTKRWQEIIACDFRKISLGELWAQVMIGAFLNQCLPSSVGGDVYRGFMAKRQGLSTEWAINSTLIDRFYGLVGLIFAGFLALPFEIRTLMTTYLGQIILGCLFLTFFGFVILLFFHRIPLFNHPFLQFFRTFSQRLWLTVNQRTGTWNILFFSFLTSSGLFMPLYILALDMGVSIRLSQIAVTLPFIFLISVLPISFAGWGLREGTMVVCLGLFGVDKEEAFALSVVFGFVQIVASLPGLIIWLFRKSSFLKAA